MKLKSLFILSLAVFLLLSWRFIDERSIPASSKEQSMLIRMRDIGHNLLLNTGDSTSRVLPISKLEDNAFQIKFESQISFEPDSLVRVVRKSMSNVDLSTSYVVNVLECETNEVVYGFEILGNNDKDVVPCLGRPLPKQCYEIRLHFEDSAALGFKYIYPGASLIFCLFLAFLVFKKKNPDNTQVNGGSSKLISFGAIEFFHEKQLLKSSAGYVELTTKENQVLKILASSPNETISREKIQKEVWEDEGVLVGRSLDVFISKLRKKLEADPKIRIVNVHGKGYKLEIT